MSPLLATTLWSVLLLLCQWLARVGAYAIDDSCKPYESDNQDKTQMITSAMAAAQNMAVNAANKVVQSSLQSDGLDHSKEQCFPQSTQEDWNQIQDNYQSLVQNTRRSIPGDVLTIYCGDANFAPNPDVGPNVWIDLTSAYNVYSTLHNNAADAQLCEPGDLAQTLDYFTVQNPNHVAGEEVALVIILCDGALVKGIIPESTGSQSSISAINALTGTAGLHPGKLMDHIMYAASLASVLVHELMHVTQMSSFTRGSTEVYGWPANTALGLQQALRNIDSFAFYATGTVEI